MVYQIAVAIVIAFVILLVFVSGYFESRKHNVTVRGSLIFAIKDTSKCIAVICAALAAVAAMLVFFTLLERIVLA